MIDPAAVKSNTDTAALIGRTVRLRRTTNGVHIGICPAHNGKGPHLWVYPGDRGFHCFSCLFSGDAIDWVMWRDKVDFKTALRTLAAEAGLTDERPAEKPILPPRDPRYPHPRQEPRIGWGGQHLMTGAPNVLLLHEFPGRRDWFRYRTVFRDHDVIWWPTVWDPLCGWKGVMAPEAARMDLAPIALQGLTQPPPRNAYEHRRAVELERLILRWRGYRIMARTRRHEHAQRVPAALTSHPIGTTPVIPATNAPAKEVRTEPAASLSETAISHDAAA